MPTILFSPRFGPETISDQGGTKLNSPPVYLVFWMVNSGLLESLH